MPSDSRLLRTSRRTAAAAGLLYLLVAFEFFYMFSPFAAYIYGVYGPGLEFLGEHESVTWLTRFFMPHVTAETRWALVNAHNEIGGLLFALGLAGFVIGAVQVYRSKLRRDGMVASLLYRWIRHPQYSALIVAGFGMVLIWPRFLVLLSFVTLTFAYILLARAEERICAAQFSDYGEYKSRTGMFMPRRFEMLFWWIRLPQGLWQRMLVWLGAYVVACVISVAVAAWVKSQTIDALYGVFEENAAYLSLGELPQERLDRIVAVATSDPRVLASIASADTAMTLGYILPQSFYVSEIPMHLPPGESFSHTWPEGHDPHLYKVIITEPIFNMASDFSGREIIARAINKEPIVEVYVDLASNSVTRIYGPPEQSIYGDIPVPIF